MTEQSTRTSTTLVLFISISVVPCFVHGAHPLITEDTGTQGIGRSQLELTVEREVDKEEGIRAVDSATNAVFSYGVTDQVDVILTLPYLWSRLEASGAPISDRGTGDFGVDTKWRFREGQALSLAIKTGFTVPSGDENRGFGAGEPTYSVSLIATYDPPPWAVNFHVSRIENDNDLGERTDLWHVSAGGWRQIGETLRLVLDTGATTNTDTSTNKSIGVAILGLIYSPSDAIDLDFGIKWGVTRPAPDYALLGGVTLRF